MANSYPLPSFGIDPKRIDAFFSSDFVHMDGNRSLAAQIFRNQRDGTLVAPQIRHDPLAVLVAGRQVQQLSAGVATTGKDALVRDQMPPLFSVQKDPLQYAQLSGAGRIQSLLPRGQHAPTVIVPVS